MMQTNADRHANTQPQSIDIRHHARLAGAMRVKADLLAVLYIGVIATVASVTGAYYVMFPELAALSWDVMEQPRGRWAGSPLLLALTPPLTGVIGTVVTRTMPYGFASVLLAVAACVGVVRGLRSPVAPAISAGLLPLVLGVTSWWYPPGILFGSTLLAAISIPWKHYATSAASSHADSPLSDAHDRTVDSAVAAPERDTADPSGAPSVLPARLPLLALAAFVAFAVGMVKLTGMRFILFPPLVVILYEMLSHAERCPWVGRPVGLPVGCFLAAAGGYFFHAHFAFAPPAAMLSMVWGIAVLRLLDLHVPPALAVALLPMVMTHPTAAYPFAVGLGTALASVWFTLFGRWCDSRLTLAATVSTAPPRSSGCPPADGCKPGSCPSQLS